MTRPTKAAICDRLAGLLLAALLLLPLPARAGFTLYTENDNNNTILKVNTNGVATLFATNGVNGRLSGPSGLVLDNLGYLYVVNGSGATGTNSIERYDPLGNGTNFWSLAGGEGSAGLALDVSNNLYLSQTVSSKVLKFTNPGAQSSVFVSGGTAGTPLGLAFDDGGNLFAGDFDGGRIYKVNPQGTVTLFVTLPPSPTPNPVGLAFDSAGNLYVALYIPGVIMRYDTNANPTTFASGFSNPYGLAFDSSGYLYVGCLGGGGTIQKVNPLGTSKTTFANSASGLTGTGWIVIQETRYTDNWFKAAGGGGASTNAEFTLNGTVGQQDAWTPMTGGQYGLVGGFWARISVVPTPGAPTLTITLTTTNTAMVSWLYPSTGWNLQQNTNLATTNWVAPAETVANNGSINYIIVNPPTGNLFFRLMQP